MAGRNARRALRLMEVFEGSVRGLLSANLGVLAFVAGALAAHGELDERGLRLVVTEALARQARGRGK